MVDGDDFSHVRARLAKLRHAFNLTFCFFPTPVSYHELLRFAPSIYDDALDGSMTIEMTDVIKIRTRLYHCLCADYAVRQASR